MSEKRNDKSKLTNWLVKKPKPLNEHTEVEAEKSEQQETVVQSNVRESQSSESSSKQNNQSMILL